MSAKKQTLFTTNNPAIPLEIWVREVLKGNYLRYLDETAAAYHQRRRLKNQAAPLLIQFWEFYENIIRYETYRKKVDSCYRIFKNDKTLTNKKALQKKFDELFCEIDWLGNEYRLCIAESYGLFTWKKMPEYSTPRPFFRLESALKIKKLQECLKKFIRWEASFAIALCNLEQELSPDLKRSDERD